MRTIVLITVGALVAIGLLLGCPKEQKPPPPQQPSKATAAIPGLPVELTVQQRTTTIVPGTNELIKVTVDDITRGQAMVSLLEKEGGLLLGPTSLREGASAPFQFSGATYYLAVRDLDNELVGDDAATLQLTDVEPSRREAATAEPSRAANADLEKTKIERLIVHIRTLEGAVFIRNGAEHSPAEAAEHLQRKWDYAGEKIETAEQFIDELASRSATTGEDYAIRLKDGTETPAGKYLHEQLAGMKASDR